ncbi:MAG: sulfotransferase [Phycisphaerales bacterium]|nr:sulfotransferase [Phycisphaerales bacterium]
MMANDPQGEPVPGDRPIGHGHVRGLNTDALGGGIAPHRLPTTTPTGESPATAGMESATIDPALRARDEAARGDMLYLDSQFGAALDRFRQAVRFQPANAHYRCRLATAAWMAGETQEVAPNFSEAIRLDPRLAMAHESMAKWSVKEGNIPAALKYSATALALSPGDPGAILARAYVLLADGQTHAAWQLVEPLVASGYATEQLAATYARLAPKVGHETQALAMVERLLRQRGRSPFSTPYLHFDAAALLDGMGRYDEAFAHARQANTLARRPFNAASNSELFSDYIRYFTPKRLRSLPRSTHGNSRPVLIVGMPRSGTSLVEQILATHPEVFGAGELASLGLVAAAVSAAGHSQGVMMPQSFDLLSLSGANTFAAEYLATITSLNSTARFVTDKMPSNFMRLGLAEVLLPDCRVIHCVRDPRDTCLSSYFNYFAGGNEFSFDLADLAAYYRDYQRMMDHWKQVLTLPMLEVRYEEVVADKEGQTRRMMEFLNLPWDERCLNFHDNKRHVATASREQVRKPIYSSSIGRWKHYEKHIPELLELVPDGK